MTSRNQSQPVVAVVINYYNCDCNRL